MNDTLLDFGIRVAGADVINQDILLSNPASPQSLNPYAYVNGQPVNYIDSFGMCREESNTEAILDNLQTAPDLLGMVPLVGSSVKY